MTTLHSFLCPVPFGTTLTLATLCWISSYDFAAAEPAQDTTVSHTISTLEPYEFPGRLSGRVTISGSTSMQPLMSKLAAVFTAFHPLTQFGVEGLPSGDAIRVFLLGIAPQRRGDKARERGTAGSNKTELLATSRPLSDQEIKAFVSHHGYEPLAVPVAMDAVAIYVHKDNPVERLTLEQVDAVFSSTGKRSRTTDITTWGAIGLDKDWEQAPIHLYGRHKASGTREFFKHVALMDGEFKDQISEHPGSASEVLAIAQDPLALGYAGVGFHTSMVRIVPLAWHLNEPAILPSASTAAAHEYPLSRTLYLYVNKNPKRPFEPVLREFLRFVHSRQGQEAVGRMNYYPLPPAQVLSNLAQLGLEDQAPSPASASETRPIEKGIDHES